MIIGNAKIGHLLKKGNFFKVLEGFQYIDEEYHIVVFGGWVTDGASVPQIFWNIFPPIAGKYLEAAILHDILYKSQILPRKKSDKIFLKAMKSLTVNIFKRWTIYLAVRFFGWRAWNMNKKQKKRFLDFIKVYKRGEE